MDLAAMAALARRLPRGAGFSHHTAAALLGLPVPCVGVVHVTLPEGSDRLRRRGVGCHVCRLADSELTVRYGLPVTNAARTFRDLGAVLRLTDLVIVGDAALRSGQLRASDLDVPPRLRGAVMLQRAIPLLEPRTDSPGESRTRLLLLDAGYARPLANPDLLDENGEWVARPDFVLDEDPVAVQYDGADHFGDARRRAQDVMRDELTRELGYEVVVVVGRDLRMPHRLVARVEAARQRVAGRRPRGRLVLRPLPPMRRPALS